MPLGFTSFRLMHQLQIMNIRATVTVRVNVIEDCTVMAVDKMKKAARGSNDYRLTQTATLSYSALQR